MPIVSRLSRGVAAERDAAQYPQSHKIGVAPVHVGGMVMKIPISGSTKVMETTMTRMFQKAAMQAADAATETMIAASQGHLDSPAGTGHVKP